ncbi:MULTISPECIES: glycosyltransferase family 2 protein [Bacillus]|uniref:Glycosyltransferase family 2 protein n=1 Tax=Bacillus wiedmannii TaxID=1890302 RepID=A0A2B6I2B1_9BACI|nr:MULTISPECIES: glycosyltransferase family 2 protein [Bacillus]MDA2733125.1 glycosyltransferase family 2 protein [Bacillus cereus]EEM69295.1 Glycosyltransferase involved in cell wall biogenesis [Bacillus thuringiensis serovar andalousiensis BGSC 4AW1]MEB9627435.1 glycosyltransferase family 2 protein [Bacillus anthracis]MED2930772.1 glycosyltransferase family 2 protein [Bacillus wiedmannii]MED3397955.1 glycosyltransferase family 2 protein [Bacillus wiedmannii]
MSKKKLIIIPAYNESTNLIHVVEDIEKNAPDFDYVIINDCSKDDTEQICKDNNFNYVSLPINLGIGGGMQTGYKYAQRQGYDVAVQFDGDGQHDAAYLGALLQEMEETGADMVIGSRFINKEGFQSSFTRRLGIRFFEKLIRIVSGKRITDATSGFRMVNNKIINEFCEYYPKDYPEPESIVAVLRNNYQVKEVPVLMRERMGGTSSIVNYKAIYYMIKVTLAISIDRLKPKRKENVS